MLKNNTDVSISARKTDHYSDCSKRFSGKVEERSNNVLRRGTLSFDSNNSVDFQKWELFRLHVKLEYDDYPQKTSFFPSVVLYMMRWVV